MERKDGNGDVSSYSLCRLSLTSWGLVTGETLLPVEERRPTSFPLV